MGSLIEDDMGSLVLRAMLGLESDWVVLSHAVDMYLHSRTRMGECMIVITWLNPDGRLMLHCEKHHSL